MSFRRLTDAFKSKSNDAPPKRDEKLTLTSFQSPDSNLPPIEEESGSFWSR